MVEQGDVKKLTEALDARLDELGGIANVREQAAQATLKKAAEKLDQKDFQIATELQERSRLLERAATDSEWLNALSTHIPSLEIVLKVWDEKNELTRERIEQEQRVAEDHT